MTHFLLAAGAAISVLLSVASAAHQPVRWFDDDQFVEISNGFSYIRFNKLIVAIDIIAADFSGDGNFMKTESNVLSAPITLEMLLAEDDEEHCIYKAYMEEDSWGVQWIEQTTEKASFSVALTLSSAEDLHSCGQNGPMLSERWTISLSTAQRAVSVAFNGHVAAADDGDSEGVQFIRHRIPIKPPSLYGLFERGVLQMRDNQQSSCLGSSDSFERLYFMGAGCALDILRSPSTAAAAVSTTATSTTAVTAATVLRSLPSFGSEYQDVIFGEYPRVSLNYSNAWSPLCWQQAAAVPVPQGASWQYEFLFIPNNYDFPVFTLNQLEPKLSSAAAAATLASFDQVVSSSASTVTNAAAADFDSLRSRLTSVYGSPVGCLQSYYVNQRGIIAPTIAAPEVGYSPDTNFFDPDNFISLSALLYSGEPYLWQQVRDVLWRTAQTMCGLGSDADVAFCDQQRQHLYYKRSSSSRSKQTKGADSISERFGQLMHHFIALDPTYESIAGSEQLGPNVFWTLCALRYIALTQDHVFAVQLLPFVRASVDYVISFFDAEAGLMRAPGPLWIDVLVRENYTADSNAMMIPFIQEAADYFSYILTVNSDSNSGSQLQESIDELQQLRRTIASNMVDKLWSMEDDHFITQLNLDGTTRDFIDYDANLIAAAFFSNTLFTKSSTIDNSNNASNNNSSTDDVSVDWEALRQRLLVRVDSGEFTHVRGTWCSEVPYSGDREDCYIVGGDVCGDSVVTLARIGWVDALARQQVRDERTFYELLLWPLQADVMESVWLYERYDSSGMQVRTANYFEYPSLIVMMQWEVQYGISIGLLHVTLDPLPYNRPFVFTAGALIRVEYPPQRVLLQLPGSSSEPTTAVVKAVTLKGMLRNNKYRVLNSCDDSDVEVVSSPDAVVSFSTTFVDDCVVRIETV